MGWLVSYTLGSMAVAFVVVKVFDYAFDGVNSGLVSVARASLFVLTWTAVTAQAGMHGLNKRVRQIREGFIGPTLRRVRDSIHS